MGSHDNGPVSPKISRAGREGGRPGLLQPESEGGLDADSPLPEGTSVRLDEAHPH